MPRILFVPGIKGTELYEGDEKENRKWFPKTKADFVALNIENELTPGDPIGKLTAFGVIPIKIYADLFQSFEENEIVPFGYDWRKSVLTHVGPLTTLIEQLATKSDDNKVVIVAHSMGGIIAKLALLELESQNKHDLVSKLITLGTPWLGSVDSYKALLYGEPGAYAKFAEFYRFLSDAATRELARQLPSVYELLPHKSYFDDEEWGCFEGAKDIDSKYSNFMQKIQQIYNAKNKKSIDQPVPNVHDWLVPIHKKIAAPLPPGIQHYCLIGHGNITLHTLPEADVNNKGKRIIFKPFSKFKNGDGVVPIKSARSPHPGAIERYVEGEHSELCSYESSIEFIKWCLAGDEKAALPTGIEIKETTTDDTMKVGFMARIKCPVDSTIVDSDGNYVAGVFDPVIEKLSPLAETNSIQYYRIGESKYMYVKDGTDTDLTFEISAYDSGLVDVSLEKFDEESSTVVEFEPIPINNKSTAVLTIPFTKDPTKATLKDRKGSKRSNTKTISNLREPVEKPPIPELKINFKPVGGVKKVKYHDVYSGAVKLIIEPEIEQVFYTINDGDPIYFDNSELDLPSGHYVIKAFGKDNFNRITKVAERKIAIDKDEPHTKLNLTFEPDGLTVQFNPLTYGLKTETFYKLPSDKEFKLLEDTELNFSWSALKLNNAHNSTFIEYYSVNEFEMEEVPKVLNFKLGNIDVLMWEDHGTRLTPQTIFSNIVKDDELKIDEFKISLLGKKQPMPTTPDKEILDNVPGVRFDSILYQITVMYAEKYGLFFSGAPTEVVKVGEDYNFSFQLLTDRTGEKILNSNPKAYLHIVGSRHENDLPVKLKPINGVFHGTIKVTESFLQNRYRLIITDRKNTDPALREISFVLKEDDSN